MKPFVPDQYLKYLQDLIAEAKQKLSAEKTIVCTFNEDDSKELEGCKKGLQTLVKK